MCFLRVHTLFDCRALLSSDDEEVHDEDGQEDVHEEDDEAHDEEVSDRLATLAGLLEVLTDI